MAEKLTKSLTDKKPKSTQNKGLSDIPEKKPKERKPKIIKRRNIENNRPRSGSMQMGINPNEKPKIMNDGYKI